MPTTDRPLTSAERAVISEQLRLALKQIGAERAAAPPPDKLQELVSQSIDSHRMLAQPLDAGTLQNLSLSLGSLWGQTACDQFGWTWALVSRDVQGEMLAIVTPNRSHVVFPLQLIHRLLAHPENGQSSLAVFEALNAERLPEAADHAYLRLGKPC